MLSIYIGEMEMLLFGNILKTNRARILVTVFALHFCVLALLPVGAQDGDAPSSTAGTARPKIQSEGAVPLGRGGYDPNVFVAEGSSADQPGIYLFHEPLIFIQADDRGRIVHHIGDAGVLTLYVRWDPSPESTQEEIRRYFAERRGAPSESWVINPLIATSARFESSRDPNVVSNPLPPNTSFTARGDIQVYFEFETQEAAAKFVGDLQGRQVGERPQDQLVFKYSFEGVSEEKCTAAASYEDIQQIGRFRELFGEGREGYAQRHQLARIAQDIRNTATTTGRCSDAELLRQITNQAMGQLGSPDERPIDQLGEYASLDNDLRSDLSNSLNETSQAVTRDQDQEAFRQAASQAGSVSGSAEWKPFAASLAGSFSNASEEARQKFRDVLRKHGMSGEWQGTQYVPRTLDVYSKERMDSLWAQGVQIEYALTAAATAEFPIVLTQQSWLRGGQEPHQDPEVLIKLEERFLQRIKDLRKELRDVIEESHIVRKELDNTRKLLNEMRVRIEPGEAGEHYTVHTSSAGTVYQQALSAGLVTATADIEGAGLCVLSWVCLNRPCKLRRNQGNVGTCGVSQPCSMLLGVVSEHVYH